MSKLIEPLKSLLTQYPELSAQIIVIVSALFTSLAALYAALQEQEKIF